jgi:alpha-glucosidase
MEYEFPNQDFENCNDQFMLGDQFLVAPVIDENDYRYVKLPKGKWRDELGNIYDGGKTIKIDAPIERLPYFEKIN